MDDGRYVCTANQHSVSRNSPRAGLYTRFIRRKFVHFQYKYLLPRDLLVFSLIVRPNKRRFGIARASRNRRAHDKVVRAKLRRRGADKEKSLSVARISAGACSNQWRGPSAHAFTGPLAPVIVPRTHTRAHMYILSRFARLIMTPRAAKMNRCNSPVPLGARRPARAEYFRRQSRGNADSASTDLQHSRARQLHCDNSRYVI